MDIQSAKVTPGQSPKKNRVKVGRVVTSFGQWKWMERWVDDPNLRQPFVSWVFVNDKPDDPAPESLRAKLTKLGPILDLPVNSGRCLARNIGARALDCDWLDFVDGDDLPRPFDVNFDESWHNVGLVFFEVRHHRTNHLKETCRTSTSDVEQTPLDRAMINVFGNVDCRPAAVLWRSEIFHRLGGFDGRAEYVEDLDICLRARQARVPFTNTPQVKADYQVDTPGRSYPPIVAVASLRTWERARAIAVPDYFKAIDDQIRFYRRDVLWSGMRELDREPISLFEKLRECAKWLAGRHSREMRTILRIL